VDINKESIMASKNRHTHNSAYDLRGDMKLLKKALSGTTKDMKGKAGEMFYQSLEDMKERSNNLQDIIGHYAAERPLKSLGIALAAGFIMGYIMHK
jgi:ElaB/YqjD/DUF883 family membrane-anchored ribosome-binding protein